MVQKVIKDYKEIKEIPEGLEHKDRVEIRVLLDLVVLMVYKV